MFKELKDVYVTDSLISIRLLEILKETPEGLNSSDLNDILDAKGLSNRTRNSVNRVLNILLNEQQVFAVKHSSFYVYYHSIFKPYFKDSERIDKPRRQTQFAQISEELADTLVDVLFNKSTKEQIINVLKKYTEMTNND
jgi:hypothetical protein